MNNCGGCIAIILVATTVAGCGTTAIQGRGVPRLLIGIEMDEVSAGSAAAMANARAFALGIVPQTTAATNTLASTGMPRSAPPFFNLITLNYASSQAVATASNAWLTVADGSTSVAVDGGGRRSQDRCRNHGKGCRKGDEPSANLLAVLRVEHRTS